MRAFGTGQAVEQGKYATMTLKVGIDVGGTFTDFLLMETGRPNRMFKVLSTPDDPSNAVIEGLESLARERGQDLAGFLATVDLIVHGTTVTTNAVLTGRVARTALFTTAGFRDALEMRRGVRERLYDNKFAPAKPLVPRTLRLPVTERTDYAGAIVTPVDLDTLEADARTLKDEGIEAIAVCFMHAHANPENERKAAERLRALFPDAYHSVSSEVLPQIRFYERVSTTVLNAAVGPILKRYMNNLVRKIEAAGYRGILLIMQSNGGVTTPASVSALAASTLLSGPAAAPVAGLAYMKPHNRDSFITVDMGGTSFDAALCIGGEPLITTDGSVERMALALPSMEIITVGSGGGSIAWIDDGGLLRMGPQSAGARPGPVCYGLGGQEPTCSDANLVLGYLNPDFFAGGRIKLDVAAAREAIDTRIGAALGIDTIAAAAGMYRIMNVNMASAIREISVQKGYDPRSFPLICAGGAGALHAAMIARELGIREIFIPREASIFCAAGMLRSDLKHNYVRSFLTPMEPGKVDLPGMLAMIDDMIAQGRARLTEEGVAPEQCSFGVQLDLRYAGQYHEVSVDIAPALLRDGQIDAIRDRLHETHNRLYGYDLRAEGTAVELVNLRVNAVGHVEKPVLTEEPLDGPDASHAFKGKRAMYLPSQNGFCDAPVYDGDRLRHGNRLSGPALVEAENATIVVPDGFALSVDSLGTCILTMIEG